ncbi:chemotaxis protein CheX [Ornithinibacillus sp. L9]|uniref:Chemotaxis protein CheX n=1 Tax=Ornithinibacillus caprae TaxID=2678566 RepID=A0A6N8FNR3_9BACI|nr:chemotaxis protein CheX [Ornithinibacillus caprae]MUK89038.1 chemotaxis protein CheX [Ornithinibacillus caprae]
MTTVASEKSKSITSLLNGTITSIKGVVPIQHEINKPQLLQQSLKISFGVLIGITGDIKGKIVLSGDTSVFGSIGQAMFGMPLEGEMLSSFSGELGNMIAGQLSTNIVENGIKTDITAPTIIEGNTTLSGYEKAIHIKALFESVGELGIYLLVD